MSRKISISTTDASFRDVQAYHASQKLALIDERLVNKLQALEALKLTVKSDPKVIHRNASEFFISFVEGALISHTELSYYVAFLWRILVSDFDMQTGAVLKT